MSVQNINNHRRGKRPNTIIKSGAVQKGGIQRTGSIFPNVNQVLKQASTQYQRNLQSANPANLAGAYLHTSQYSDSALADAKKRAAKGDIISQLYVHTANTLVKDSQDLIEKHGYHDNLGVRFSAHAASFLPSTIAQIPATLQAINLIQQGQSDVIKKGYQALPGIITNTVDYALSNPVGFAGSLAAGAALGGVGAGRVKITKGTTKTQDSAVSNTGKTTPQTQTKLVTQLPRSAFDPKITNRGPHAHRQILTQKRGVDNSVKVQPEGIKTTPASTSTQQRTVIRGNVPSEFRGNVGQGYSANVKIRGNTFVLTPMDNRITINTPSPSTLRPISFDDIVQNLVKGQGIAIKTGDRKATVTNLRGAATLEPGGVRARFPDYQPNVYRPISSDDYFASAIGGRKNAGVDIYTYPFGVQRDFAPNLTPKSIKALNADTLFRLMDKTLNPAPQRLQDLSSFKGNPRLKEIELVEAGQTTKPRELPANIQPLRIARITEYVTEYQKISFIRQKTKSRSRSSPTTGDKPVSKHTGRTKNGIRQAAGSTNADIPLSLTKFKSNNLGGVITTTLVLPKARLSSFPASVVPIPDNPVIVDSLVNSDVTTTTTTSGDVNISIPRTSNTDDSIPHTRTRQKDVDTSVKMRRGRAASPGSRLRTKNSENSELRRVRFRDADGVITQRRRRRRNKREEEEEDKKKKRLKKTVRRTYRQKVNPLPWLEDANDTSWIRKDLAFMRMPARVNISSVRPALEAYNNKVKAYNTARKKLRRLALQTNTDGRRALSTLKRLYKAAVEARGRAVKLIERNRR